MKGGAAACQQINSGQLVTYIHRKCPLVHVQVTIEDDINAICVEHSLHCLPHALILKVMSCICTKRLE